jgi:hypothetical protein
MPLRKERQTLNVDLGDLKPLVLAAAQRAGKGTAVWIREALAMAVQEHAADAVPVPMPRAAANRSRSAAIVHFGGRLTVKESEALRLAAASEGLSQIEYVARVARGELAAPRVAALDALGAVRERLQALELALRNLQARARDDPAVLAQVGEAVREVRAQARRAAEVFDAVGTTRRVAGQRGHVRGSSPDR